MTTALIAILVGVISAFSKSIFDRIFREYNPDTKKLISITKKFLLFSFKYVLPITYIIWAFIFVDFSKIFVLAISLNVTVIALNATADVIRGVSSVLIRLIFSLNDNNVKKTPDQIEQIIFDLNRNYKKVAKQVKDNDN